MPPALVYLKPLLGCSSPGGLLAFPVPPLLASLVRFSSLNPAPSHTLVSLAPGV